MAITEPEIAHLAQLAGLHLASDDAPRIRKDLDRILTLIRTLQSVDTGGVQPMAHPLEAHQDIALRLREDEPAPALSTEARDQRLASAPAVHDGLFLVPTILE